MRSSRHLDLGRLGEEMAGLFLQAHGYQIVEQNWRARGGELDLVCLCSGQVVFVEVKTRTSRDYGGPGGALSKGKQKRLSKAAARFLSERGWWNRNCRFDLILVSLESGRCIIEHVVNAFEFSPALGGGHSHWQPW